MMQDVRNHLAMAMEALTDITDADGKPIDRKDVMQRIQQANAVANLSKAYTDNVRCEIDARRLAGIKGLPSAISEKDAMPALEQAK